MDGRGRVSHDDLVHEVEELDAPPALLVHGRDFAGGHFESGKQGRCAIALVIMALAGQRPSVGQPQVSLRSLQRLDRGLFVDADDDRVLGRRHVEPDDFGGLGGKLGVVASHHDLRPSRSIFWARRKRQTCCTCTSPSSAATSGPVQRANPEGGARSRTARMRRPVSALYLGTGPERGWSAKPARPCCANRPRQVLTVRGIAPTARAIDRVERPSAASKMIRARKTSRCSVVGARTRASSTARSSGVSRTSAAWGIIPMLKS